MAGVRLLVRAIGLLSTIILARLLLPEDFGLVALAGALVFVLETFSDLRFEHAIIAQRDTTDSDLNTAFTLNLLRGTGIAIVIALIAYPYALMMDDMRLVPILLTMAAIPLIDGFKNPAFVTYEKSMQFAREFTLQLSHKILAFTVTITLAWLWRSYWALIVGIVSGAGVKVIASYLMHPYRPHLSLQAWRRLVSFSGWFMGANAVNALLQKIEFFLIGAFVPARVVGLLHVGSEISNMASNELTLPLKRALFPALSSLAAEPQRQYHNFCRAIEVIAAVALPIGLGLSLVAEPLVLLVLGERWRETAQVIEFLGPVASIWAIAGLCDTLILSRGNTRLMFNRELIRASYLIPIYSLAIWLGGLQGFLYSTPIVATLSLLLNLDMVRRQSDMPLFEPIKTTWRSWLACGAMTVSVLLLQSLLATSDDGGSLILVLTLSVSGGAAAYALAHLALWFTAGRPDGAEQFILDAVRTRLG